MSNQPQLLHGPNVGVGGKSDDRAGVEDVGRKKVGWGFTLTSTLAPQLMLRCCHFHHLKCCHFRCRSLVFAIGSGGWREGKREEVWEDFHFKQAQLCHAVI